MNAPLRTIIVKGDVHIILRSLILLGRIRIFFLSLMRSRISKESACDNSVNKLDARFNDSRAGKFFALEERGSKLSTELSAGTATFLTMAYILAVNPRILAESGGPCVPPDGDIFSPDYETCMEEVKRQYITSTAIGSMIGCLLMGLLGNLPIALAPGMGMNAYFTYSVVGWRGTGMVPYETALTAILIEGAIFLVLALTGVRFALAKLIPEPIRLATAPGIGAFLAHLGFQTAEGLGIVVSDIATAVTLGACPPDKRTPIVAYDDACAQAGVCVTSDAYTCDVLGGRMTSATTWLGIVGLLLMVTMLAYKKSSGIIAGILFVTFVSWFRNTAVTYFPDTPEGDARFDYFRQVVAVEPMDMILVKYSNDLQGAAVALLTFLYVDFMDTTGTLLGLVSHMGLLDENGDFPRSRASFSADAIATMVGSIFGLSPVTSYIESAAGVEAGGRTGLTAVFAAFYFALAVFFAPIFASIPPWATGGSLILVGALMCRSLARVQWHKVDHAVTAFVTIMLMPLTYSIAYGIIGGFFCWIVLQIIFQSLALVGIKLPHTDGLADDEVLKHSVDETHRDVTIHDAAHSKHEKLVDDNLEEVEKTNSMDDDTPKIESA
eukprot:CCRYP_007006-RA/>CCRYP_007006-RA protein AED:0.31 eAED:0.31 QI:219/0.75/0.6/1/0.75/0.6/5/178/607